MKVKDIIKLIEQDGWHQVRQKGSHRQFTLISKEWSQWPVSYQ